MKATRSSAPPFPDFLQGMPSFLLRLISWKAFSPPIPLFPCFCGKNFCLSFLSSREGVLRFSLCPLCFCGEHIFGVFP